MSVRSSAGTLTVAVLAGGRSSEHEVSLSSAASVRDGLAQGGHRVESVQIEPDGSWTHERRRLSVRPGEGLLGADVVFPALHGPFGEDGTVQGLLESLDVAYVGSGVAASSLCMNKVLFKRLMRCEGVAQVDFEGITQHDWAQACDSCMTRVARLGLPVFVKPAHLGSSLGIAKAADEQSLREAIEAAFAHDELVIVEALADATEVECGVLGRLRAQADGGEPAAFASEPGEIVLQGDWYDFDSKYAPGGMWLRVPAAISARAAECVRATALQAFLSTGCEGLARADFFVDGERVLLNELNTMPGFTPTSVYARLLEHSGVPYPELVDRLCRLALERHQRSHALRH